MNIIDLLLYICDCLIPQNERLCLLDSKVGDGDHGVTVERGFRALKQALPEARGMDATQVLKLTGEILGESMGGAIGPIMGAFFSGSAKKLESCGRPGTEEYEIFLTQGLKRVQTIGGAQEGDCTLVDALSPAVKAYCEAREARGSLNECLDAAVRAAWAGVENTKSMIAKRGRARFVAERSLGCEDAGATTMALILEAIRDYAREGRVL